MSYGTCDSCIRSYIQKGHNTERRTLTMITRSQKQDGNASPKNNNETTTRKTAASQKRKKTDHVESTNKARRAKHMLVWFKRMQKKNGDGTERDTAATADTRDLH